MKMKICDGCPREAVGLKRCCHESLPIVPAKIMQQAVHLDQQIQFERKNWHQVRWTKPSFMKELEK